MQLYSGNSRHFIQDSVLNQIAEKLKNAFFSYYRYNPSPNEINSWKNSLRATAQVLQFSNLMNNGILLEYQLPMSSKRLDCMICGKDHLNQQNAVIVELKQWDKCSISECDNEVMTYVGGGLREVLHPSAQVDRYKTYLQDCHTAFYNDDRINLFACSYLHNYNYYEADVLYDAKFQEILKAAPLFTGDHVQELSDYLIEKLDEGEGEEVLRKIEESKYRPSKKLMQHVSGVIKGKSEYILLDEQVIVYDKVFASARKAFHDKQKSIIVIKGGPGTGKSVIAINLMADLLKENYNAHYSTGSKAFTETLRTIIGTRGSAQFKYFNSYGNADPNAVDVLICDEAHRIRRTSNNMYT
ncbi:MAG: DNA/RNA helicase domain-containing protein, partial [Bacteroidia bacterium]